MTLPKREITSVVDIGKWKKSKAFKEFVEFISLLNLSVRGEAFKSCGQSSGNISKILLILTELESIIDLTPPHDEPQRYGNKAYRDWHQKMSQTAALLVAQLSPLCAQNCDQLMPYLLDSFGNAARIDYGTGHEAAFVMFLLCLSKLDVFQQSDLPCLVSHVFRKYIRLCQRLQLTYRMEPAGSHGVWCLDDYQFLPFVLGSSQLIGNEQLPPSSFLQEGLPEKLADQYMFMDSIRFINEVKTGPFAEHSNQLWNISAVPTWSKVNAGLLRMYHDEVLLKFPVVQHFVFGRLFSIESV